MAVTLHCQLHTLSFVCMGIFNVQLQITSHQYISNTTFSEFRTVRLCSLRMFSLEQEYSYSLK